MEHTALKQLLDSLIATWENEVVEFKEVGDSYSTSDIGKYFSALANEANLRGHEKAWLVFGINNATRTITTSNFRPEPERLQGTKKQIADGAEPSITFRNIHELHIPDGGRVILFEIPAAPRGMPIAWHGHYYARAGESLTALGVDKQDEIRQQTLATDWTAQIVAGATITDLDEAAIQKARESFSRKYANRFTAEEMAGWSLPTFLDRAKVTQNGHITRTALLLLGKPESAHKLSPHPAQMTWKLEGTERAYEHFSTPFLLSSTQLYQRIRNIQIRLLPAGQMIPHEVSKYDQKIVLEALHNCIAHQDYRRNGRINVIEKPEKLIFENEGAFYEGTPGDYVLGDKMPRRYRNPFLVQAMVELGMIDTMGYGIHRMNTGQAKRYLPLPDYDLLSEANAVRMTIYGSVVDPAYSQMLMQKTDLPFVDVLALDRVQKKLSIPDEAISRLRRSNLIEGRKPNFHVSAAVAAATDSRAEYIRTRPQHDSHYQRLILDYIKNKAASRKEIDDLLWKLLSEALDDTQKSNKIGNLLTNLRRAGDIYNAGNRKAPIWKIAEKKQNKTARLQKET